MSQDYFTNKTDMWSLDFPHTSKTLPEKNLHITKQNFELLKDCVHEPDNINITTSNLDSRNKNNSDIIKDTCPLQNKDTTVNNSMEAVDLSDLSFSCNDFIPGDCTCFEQASQLVDPTLKDSESTPFSCNNSDSVQLFRYSLSESTDDNFSCFIKSSDNLLNNQNNIEKCDDTMKSDHYNFYHVFELLDSNMNVNKETKNLKDESVEFAKQKVSKKKGLRNGRTGPIKKGRRYLPNFKQKVMDYAKNHTFKETALHFKINCNTITEWSREHERLSLKHKDTTSMPGSDYKNYKTDIVGTPDSKTDIILLNDDISLETDFNESSLVNIEEDLPSADMKADERFLKWIETKRLQRKQLSRQEVFYIAKCCLRKCPVPQEKPSWFVLWFKRFNKVLKNSVKTSIETEKYIKYPNSFKLEVALYARIFTKNSAARVFNIPRRRMFDWVNRLSSIKDSFNFKNETGDGIEDFTEKDIMVFERKKDKTRSKIYSELHGWYQKRFLNGARPTSCEIKEKAKEVFSSHGIVGIKFSDGWLQKFCQRLNIKLRHSDDERLLLWILTQFDNNVTLSHQEITEKSSSLIGKKKFKGSKGWTLRFLKRHRNLLQCCPTVQDQLPQIVQEKLNFFWDNFRQSLISLRLEPANIGCMDEIALSFNYPEEGKTTSLPLLRKTGFENCQGVAILCTLGNGRILPPAVVFKGNGPKQLLSNQNVDILIFYEEKGLITVDILKAWANNIWLSCIPTPSVLVVDSFVPHCAIELRQLLAKENCLLHVIPEGCSSRFQPLDVEVTPVFKKAIKNQWKEFPTNSSLSSSKLMRKYRCPDQDTILHWVQNAYEKIKRNPVSIINSFKTTGLLQ